MALRMGHVYDALRTAQGVSEEAARAAAEEIANYENSIQEMKRDLAVLKWAVAANLGLSLLILGKLFSI